MTEQTPHRDEECVKTTPRRDVNLDIYRALVIMYILCVIHIIFWIPQHGLGEKSYFTSLILIEMPLIFFISGASLSVSRPRKSFFKTVKNRVKRVVLPYYIYVILCAAVVVVLTLIGFPRRDPHFVIDDIIGCLVPDGDENLLGNMSHLWFIIPYFITACSFPFQRRLIKYTGKVDYFLLTVIIFLFCAFLPWQSIRYAACYNIFFMGGYMFYRKISWKTIYWGAGVLGALLLIIEFWGTGLRPMSVHKITPDMIFVAYGLFAILIMSIIFGHIRLRHNRITRIWDKYGYTIYLYQNFVLFVGSIFIDRYAVRHSNLWLSYVAAAIFVFASATIAGVVFGKTDMLITKFLENLWHGFKIRFLKPGKSETR